MVLPLLALLVLGTVGVASWRTGRVDPPGWSVRSSPRPRRSVGPRLYRAAQLLGFRYSVPRDALVLRLAHGRYGPVLRLREEWRVLDAADLRGTAAVEDPPPAAVEAGAAEAGADPATVEAGASAPAADGDARGSRVETAAGWTAADAPVRRPALALRVPPIALAAPPLLPPGRAAAASPQRVVDVAILPLPPLPGGQGLWQLTAVDVEALFAWADVTRANASGAPAPRAATTFVRSVARDLEERGLQLDAIVVRPGSTDHPSLFDNVVAGGVRLLRIAPGTRRGRVAMRLHARAVGSYWRVALDGGQRRSLQTLRRGLRGWVQQHNDASPASPPGRPATPPPAEALPAGPPRLTGS